MRYQALIVLVTLGTFAAVSTATAVGIGLSWPRLDAAFRRLPARARARRLVELRLAPLVFGLLACVISLLAFLRHEPRNTLESPGWILLGGAAVGAALVVSGLWRLIGRCRTTYRFLQMVERTAIRVAMPDVPLPAWQLDTTLPLVALAGFWRPCLLVARRVLEQVPCDELQVIAKHELAHARRRDNVVRLALSGLPDILNLVRPDIERAWHEAAEEAADDMATVDDPLARLSLASALIRVAKMTGIQAVPAVPVLAFHSGECVERRVHRLLDRPEDRSAAPLLPLAFRAAIVLSAAAGLWLRADVLLGAHRAIEWLVNARL